MNLLIVDDELHFANGLGRAIERETGFFERVVVTYSMKQAQEILQGEHIDVMLCDIEMPRGSGFDLVEWVRAKELDAVCIFLTSHAVFEYANRAIRLESLDYLLKPVRMEELVPVLERAVAKVEEKRRQRHPAAQMRWERSQEALAEQFWMQIADGTLPTDPGTLQRESYMFPPGFALTERLHCPLLIRMKPDDIGAADWEPALLRVAFKNIVIEKLFPENAPRALPQISDHLWLAVLSRFPGHADMDGVLETCSDMLAVCQGVLPVQLKIFTDTFVPLTELSREIGFLRASMMDVVHQRSQIHRVRQELRRKEAEEPGASLDIFASQSVMDRILAGDGSAVCETICTRLDELAYRNGITRPMLQKLYLNLLQAFSTLLAQQGLQAHLVFQDPEMGRLSEAAGESVPDMKAWIRHALRKVHELAENPNRDDEVIETVRQHIRANLAGEINRSELAAKVFLTPDYLSHLFRSRTGSTLTDFIKDARMQKAQHQLRFTKVPVGEIAEQVGYASVSHFTQVFRRHVGMTPLEYRKKPG